MIINLIRSMRNTAKRTDKNNLGHCILLFEAANEIERLQKKLSVAETRSNQTTRCKNNPFVFGKVLSLFNSQEEIGYAVIYQRRTRAVHHCDNPRNYQRGP